VHRHGRRHGLERRAGAEWTMCCTDEHVQHRPDACDVPVRAAGVEVQLAGSACRLQHRRVHHSDCGRQPGWIFAPNPVRSYISAVTNRPQRGRDILYRTARHRGPFVSIVTITSAPPPRTGPSRPSARRYRLARRAVPRGHFEAASKAGEPSAHLTPNLAKDQATLCRGSKATND
jgi:hypothetical protein